MDAFIIFTILVDDLSMQMTQQCTSKNLEGQKLAADPSFDIALVSQWVKDWLVNLDDQNLVADFSFDLALVTQWSKDRS